MALDKYYSKEEIAKRLRLKLKPKPIMQLDKLRKFVRGGNDLNRLPPLDR